ncbi:hypothetical protein niasHS_011615 [Heterodera schachtii]|uniref:Uncharacterized protein n=1 Tax=Heterodera schachtii TaxID=97005 RepID=A0ABD2IC84_HETSC
MSSGWEFVLYFLLMQAPIATAGIIIDGNDKPAAIELNVIVDDRTPTLKAKSDDKPANIHVDNEQQKHERGIQALPLLFNKNCELDDFKCQLREFQQFGPNFPSTTSFKPGKADLDTMFRRMLTKTYTKQQKQQMAKIVKEMVDKKQMKQEHGIGKHQNHGDKLIDDEHQQRALPNDADLLRKKVAAAGGENDSPKVPIVLIGNLDPEQAKALKKAVIPIGHEKLA